MTETTSPKGRPTHIEAHDPIAEAVAERGALQQRHNEERERLEAALAEVTRERDEARAFLTEACARARRYRDEARQGDADRASAAQAWAQCAAMRAALEAYVAIDYDAERHRDSKASIHIGSRDECRHCAAVRLATSALAADASNPILDALASAAAIDAAPWLARYHAEHADHGGASFELHARAQTWVTTVDKALAAIRALGIGGGM